MASEEFDFEHIEVSEMIEGLTAVVLAPIVLPIAAGVSQPFAKTAIKEGIAFSQRCKEAVADARERLEDLMAEAQAELAQEQQAETPEEIAALRPPQVSRTHFSQGTSEAAGELIDMAAEMNAQIGWLTKGFVDLRLLLPLGLGSLALRQLIIQGLEIDKIPWYTLAWYALDTFVKFNQPQPGQVPTTAQQLPPTPEMQAASTGGAS